MAAGKQNAKVSADIRKNRLYITLAGTIRKKEAENIYTDVRFCVADLQPGFDVVTDLTEARIGHLISLPVFLKIIEYLKASKVGRIVRVVGRGKTIIQQMAKATELVNGYKPIYVASLAEAEEILTAPMPPGSAAEQQKNAPDSNGQSGA
jgi:hypothetical protein